VGLVVHSCLLVPYYSWKHSHRRHHSNTGSLAKDEVGGRAGGRCGQQLPGLQLLLVAAVVVVGLDGVAVVGTGSGSQPAIATHPPCCILLPCCPLACCPTDPPHMLLRPPLQVFVPPTREEVHNGFEVDQLFIVRSACPLASQPREPVG
jgi:hypothetical protein